MATDPYAVLGLPPGAPLAEVKRAYRRLAKAFHPDSAGAAALPRFLAIHEAYERITTGRVLPGAARADAASPPREPWRADPARARATRRRASARNTTGPARSGSRDARTDDEAPAGAATGAAGGNRRSRGSGGRRAASRKATLGSTSYDEARDRVDAAWSGASWYGPTSGEYWIINPREYADPRKHGPAYQARVRQAMADGASAQPDSAESVFDRRAEDGDVPPREPSPREAPPREPPAREPPPQAEARPRRATTAPRERPRFTGETRPGAASGATAQEGSDDEPGVRWPLLGGSADDPMRRLRLALVAWPPLGVAAAIAAGDVTGCASAAASCTGVAPLTPWLAQVAILALLMLLPPVARFLAFGTVAVLLALVPATAVLLALGAGSTPEAGFALGVLVALAWLAGVAYAAVSAARRASLSSVR